MRSMAVCDPPLRTPRRSVAAGMQPRPGPHDREATMFGAMVLLLGCGTGEAGTRISTPRDWHCPGSPRYAPDGGAVRGDRPLTGRDRLQDVPIPDQPMHAHNLRRNGNSQGQNLMRVRRVYRPTALAAL